MVVVPRYDTLEDLNRPWNLLTILFKLNVVQVEIEHVPVAGVRAFGADLVFWNILRIGVSGRAIRLEARLRPEGKELLTDDRGCLFQSGDPLELRSFPPGLD